MSSDGDSRLLKAMEIIYNIGPKKLNYTSVDQEFDAEFWKPAKNIIPMQDGTHLVVKAGRRPLKHLILGDFSINMGILNYMIDNKSKEKHGLVKSDITSKDKMNFSSVEKLCSARVLECLGTIPSTEGVILYLKFVRNLITAYVEGKSTVEERLFSSFYCLYFARLWKEWIQIQRKTENFMHKNEEISLNNFLSSNTYACIEINALSIVKMLRKCIDLNRPDLFMPTLMSSQACEEYFRRTRSMTSTFQTITEYDMLEILNRSKRSQALVNLSRKIQVDDKKRETNKLYVPEKLPNRSDVLNIINAAYKSASEDLLSIGKKILLFILKVYYKLFS